MQVNAISNYNRNNQPTFGKFHFTSKKPVKILIKEINTQNELANFKTAYEIEQLRNRAVVIYTKKVENRNILCAICGFDHFQQTEAQSPSVFLNYVTRILDKLASARLEEKETRIKNQNFYPDKVTNLAKEIKDIVDIP